MTDLTVNGSVNPNDKVVIQDERNRRMRSVTAQSIKDFVLDDLDPERIPLLTISSDDTDRTFDISKFKSTPRYINANQSSGRLTIDCSNVGYISTGNTIKFILTAKGDCEIGFSSKFKTEYDSFFKLLKGQNVTIAFISINNTYVQDGEIALVQ